MREALTVALGPQRYRVERPWGDLPTGPGVVSDVACDARGRVFVLRRADPYVDPPAPMVIVLAPDGSRIAAWGEAVLDGHMLRVYADGRVFVVDRDAHEVTIFAPDGTRLGGLGARHGPGAPFHAPCDVAFGADGAIWVADGYANSRLHRFAPDGTLVASIGRPGRGPGEFSTPHAVAVLADGRVAVADRENHRVQLFTPAGAWAGEIGDLHKPMAVLAVPDGGLLVTDQVPRLSHFDAAGQLIGRCRPVLNGAHGLALAADGTLYCAEIAPSRLTRLSPA